MTVYNIQSISTTVSIGSYENITIRSYTNSFGSTTPIRTIYSSSSGSFENNIYSSSFYWSSSESDGNPWDAFLINFNDGSEWLNSYDKDDEFNVRQ